MSGVVRIPYKAMMCGTRAKRCVYSIARRKRRIVLLGNKHNKRKG